MLPWLRSIVDVIGRTPLVELTRSVESRGLSGRLLVKLEYFSPGGSKKDRIALEIIREAGASGKRRLGQTVVEMTSGHTGTGLAVVRCFMGHPFVPLICAVILSSGFARWRRSGRRSLSLNRPREPWTARARARTLSCRGASCGNRVAARHAFRVDQFRGEGNILAHERHTGPKLWAQSQGQIDVFLDTVGTCGSFTGVARSARPQPYGPNVRRRTGRRRGPGRRLREQPAAPHPRGRLWRTDLDLFDKTIAFLTCDSVLKYETHLFP